MTELTEAGIDARAIEGETSQFDVIADGRPVFSKQREGRFPEEGEALLLLLAV